MLFSFFSCVINPYSLSYIPKITVCKGPSIPSPTPSTSNTNIWNLPTTTTTQRTTTTTTTRRAWTTKAPFYNPSNPSYGGGGNYFGNRYGDDSIYGGGGSSFTTKMTTRRPSSSSSGSSFDSILSGLSGFLSSGGGKLLQDFLGNKGGSGSSGSGGFGSLFGSDNTRPLIENPNYRGGLFNEAPGKNSNTPGSYPVTRYGDSTPSRSTSQSSTPSASHGSYGWKLS